jgi:hypothetical protein
MLPRLLAVVLFHFLERQFVQLAMLEEIELCHGTKALFLSSSQNYYQLDVNLQLEIVLDVP